jgi:hypothetical protein
MKAALSWAVFILIWYDAFMTERPPHSEFSEIEQTIVERLRANGPDDPETRGMLLAWRENEEEKANTANTARAGVEIDLNFAKLLRAAGGYESAWATLEAVREMAQNLGEQDLYDQAMAIMDAIDDERQGK